MIKRKSFIGKIILLIIVLALGIIIIYNYGKRKEKENNLYKLGSSEQVPIKLSARGICIFNERLVNVSNSDKKGVTLRPSLTLLRNKDKIADKEDLRLEDEKISTEPRAAQKEGYPLSELIKKLESTEIYKLALSSKDSINEINKFYKAPNKDESDKSIRAVQSGYLANFTDGYEEILGPDNVWTLFDEGLEENKKVTLNYRQKKFVDNKFYYILADVKDFDKYEGIKIQNLPVQFMDSKKTFNAGEYTVLRTSNKRPYLLITMYEGIDHALTNRIKDLSIEINKLRLMKIPTSAIKYNGKNQGVYLLNAGKVQFARVKNLYESDNYSYCLYRKEDLFSKAYLDRVEKNNRKLGYKSSDEDYIDIYELKDYSTIILDPRGLKEGDKY